MKNIPDKCSRCGAPIDWEKGSSSTKCSFCGKTNYLKSYFFNEFKNKLTFKNTKNILLNPISIFLIILLPVVFSRFIIQSNKYKKFDNAYLAEEACWKDAKKLSKKDNNAWCDKSADKTIRLIYEDNKEKRFKLSKESKSIIQKSLLETSIPLDIYYDSLNKNEAKRYGCSLKNEDELYKNYLEEIEQEQENILRDVSRPSFLRYGYVNLEKEGFPWYDEDRNGKLNPVSKLVNLKLSLKALSRESRKIINPDEYMINTDKYGVRSKDLDKEEISFDELLTIRVQQIKWLEEFLKEHNKKLAFQKVRKSEIKHYKKCISSVRSRDIKKVRWVFRSIPEMIKCEKYKSDHLKKNQGADLANFSIICDHPILEKKSSAFLLGFKTKELESKTYKKDILLKIKKSMIQKYYLY